MYHSSLVRCLLDSTRALVIYDSITGDCDDEGTLFSLSTLNVT